MSKGLRLLAAVSMIALAAACGKKTADKTAAPEPATSPTVEASPPIEPTKVTKDEFESLVGDVTRTYFADLPEMATYYGAPANAAGADANARLTPRSQAAEEKRRADMEASLDALKELSGSNLGVNEREAADSLIALLDAALAPSRVVDYGSALNVYGFWFTPYVVLQNSGPLVDVPNLMEAQQAVATTKDADDYLKRLDAFAPMIDDVIAKMKADAELGVAPPDFIIKKCRNVIANFTGTPAKDNVLVASFAKKLDADKVEGAGDYVAHATKTVEEGVYPAEKRLDAYLAEVEPTASHDAGLWRLPKGPELYQAMIRHMTDTTMTADEIHEIGLKEVARIEGEMDAIMKAQGMTKGTVGERMVKLGKDPRFSYPNTPEGKAQILADIKGQLERVNAAAPKWFGTLPKYDVVVRAVPEFSQDSAPGGYYDSPAIDGSRPGTYWINLRDTAIWPKFSVPTLTYHESVPGHHFQNSISVAQDAPLISKVWYSNAFGEGWALYAESLAKEMGLYEGDPFGDLGRLRDELHRAVRLVVDTGMHAKKWSREQAIDYMAAQEGTEPSEVESEIERYVVWPGQALGYKIGMLKIEELRKKAETELGDKFDIRQFHDEVLKAGGVPLSVVEANVDRWIEKTKAQ